MERRKKERVFFGWGQVGRWRKLSYFWDMHSSVFCLKGSLSQDQILLKAHICDTQNGVQLTRHWLREGPVLWVCVANMNLFINLLKKVQLSLVTRITSSQSVISYIPRCRVTQDMMP